MRSEQTVTIVIPLLNEAESLQPLYERICEATAELQNSVELLFVDDGSNIPGKTYSLILANITKSILLKII